MNLRHFLLFTLLTFSFTYAFGTNKNKKHRKAKEEVSFIEANVIAGSGDCGFLLQLANGLVLKPLTALPKKFRDNHLKVMIKYTEVNSTAINDCASRMVEVSEIRKYKMTSHNRAKY
ncbi:MAG: hypothetical protein ACJ76F_13155 [Bacteroidia bacterium]